MPMSRDEGNIRVRNARSILMEVFDLMPSNTNERNLITNINHSLYQLEGLIKNQKCDEGF